MFDSGIRRGADIFKTLAPGARAVLVGRLYLRGLAVAGEEGVREVLLNLLAGLDLTMALSGMRAAGTGRGRAVQEWFVRVAAPATTLVCASPSCRAHPQVP